MTLLPMTRRAMLAATAVATLPFNLTRAQGGTVKIGAILSAHPRLGRHCVVAEGDPIVPPLRIYVEAPAEVDLAAVTGELHETLRARFELTRLDPGALPRAEHKTRIVHRTARGDALPPVVEHLRRETVQ